MLGMPSTKLTIGRVQRAAICMDLVFQLITRNPEGVALCFVEHGRLHLVSPEGVFLLGGYELAGIASVMRRFHENTEMLNVRVGDTQWSGDCFSFTWSCSVRNWGAGPLIEANGSCRGIFYGGLIRELDLVCDPELYNRLAFSGA
jgi:hypothetical protein